MTYAKPPSYTVTALARELGVTHPQVSQWKAAGMPFSKAGRITMAAAVLWLRNDARRERPKMGASDAAGRRAAAEAELAELKVARERGDVVPAEDVYRQAEEEATRVRSLLTQMASAHAPLVAQECACDIRTASRVLRKVADLVSDQLASEDAEEEAA